MYPILIEFNFPEFLGHLTWIELGLTVVVAAALFFWRWRRPLFNSRGFAFWVGVYALIRGLVYYAGPGYDFKLHTYGVLIAAGFVVGIVLAVRQAKKEGIGIDVVLDLSFWILIAAMVGSRVLFIIVNINDYIADPLALIKIWQGGLVFYGGFIAAVAASWLYTHKHGIDFLRISDLLIPSVAIGQVFGRLGCFTAGCCHGMPTGIAGYGAIFSDSGTVVARNHLLGVPIHPTQLYDALVELGIFLFLIFFRKRKRYNGQLLALWLLLYGAGRFLDEFFRGDTERGMLFRIDLFGDPKYPQLLSTSQLVGLLMVVGGIALWLFIRRQQVQLPGPDLTGATPPPSPNSAPPPTAPTGPKPA